MSEKHKLAAKNRIGKTPEERSIVMAARAKLGWMRMDPKVKEKRMANIRKNRWLK